MSKSKFSDNLLKGQIPRDEDWAEHLKNIHTVVPSMTPPVFGAHRTRSGLNSYEILAEALESVPQPFQVLDLACGDGVLSHMALMLMLPIEPVILQLRRILKSGGKIVGVIGGPRTSGSVSDEIAKLIAGFLRKRFPKMASPRIGDERFSTVDGLKSLFEPSLGFRNNLKVEDFQIEVKGDGDRVWNFYKDMYLVGMLPTEIKNVLRQEMMELLKSNFNGLEKILVEYPIRKFEVSAL